MKSEATNYKSTPKTSTQSQAIHKYSILALYLALSAVYLVLVLVLPPDKKALVKYQLSPSSIRLLGLVVTLPLIAIWGVGFYGYYRYQSYANTIKHTKDGVFQKHISTGLFLLALSLPISVIISNLLTFYDREHSSFMPSSVIIGNYINIAIYTAAFAFTYVGAKGLLKITNKSLRRSSEVYLMMIFTVVVGIFYYLSLHNSARQFPTQDVATAAYYLPDWLIIITVLIPYTVMWYLGTISAYRLWLYRNNVKGEIYRSAFTQLAVGLGVVVALLMTIRYLTALITVLDKLALKYLLLVVYILLIFIAIGYILIALGAKRLKKIEEV